MRTRTLTLTFALALALTGCTGTITSTPQTPDTTQTQTEEAATTAPAPVQAAYTTPEAIEALPWVSTYTVYGDSAPADPGTAYRHQTASLPAGSTYTLAYAKPGGPAFAKIGEHELSDPTALPVIDKQPGWVQVLLPGRLHVPSSGKQVNGPSGWIPEDAVKLTSQPLEVTVDMEADQVIVTEEGWLVESYPIIMDGKDLSAVGRGFAVSSYWTVEKQKCSSEKVLAVSMQSEKYDSFVDGASIQAIHGWSKECRAHSAQTTRSSGCINLADASMKDLLKRVKPGTPITFKGGTK